MRGKTHQLLSALTGVVLLCIAFFDTVAAETVLIRAASESPTYMQVIDALRTAFDSDDRIVIDTDGSSIEALGLSEGELRVVIALGSQANETAFAEPLSAPLFSLLLTREAYKTLADPLFGAAGRRIGGLFLEHPISTQMRVAQAVFPDLRKFGLMYSDPVNVKNELEGLPIEARHYEFDGNLQLTMRSLLRRVDALLAMPDPEVFNQNTIHSILLTAYRLNRPVIGYSKPYVTAGAMLAAYSDPQTIGREAAALLAAWRRTGTWPGARYPSHFSVAINHRVASVLGLRQRIDIPADAVYPSVEALP